MSDLYNRIDMLCKARETTITELCKVAKVSRATLSELNSGRTKTLTLKTAQKLANALGVSLNMLLGESDDEPISFTVSIDEYSEYIKNKKAPTSMDESPIIENNAEDSSNPSLSSLTVAKIEGNNLHGVKAEIHCIDKTFELTLIELLKQIGELNRLGRIDALRALCDLAFRAPELNEHGLRCLIDHHLDLLCSYKSYQYKNEE